ncbi:MAG: AMP-dependent synthetase [Alphaproteobacteria bacterium]|nr:AMP-dependent synthetase [Alphaproteobacteria bacterium]|tara:strand:+ start:2243 stop:3778 length:1536 start_codon:yes stop_codon:yes gene_type:complete
MSDTILDLLSRGDANAVAIGAPERISTTYDGLRAHAAQTVATLRDFGIGRNDRIAIVLPNGPEMASAFVSVAAGATTAPLNPAYRDEEFEFYLSDLNAKALIVADGDESPAVAVAKRLGITVLELSSQPTDTAGSFALVGDAAAAPSEDGDSKADDTALVLHTSGTTSRPKIVPLSHTNVCASARNISTTLSLVADDRCLNVMPLFHIHGLMGAVLSSLAAGASVHCPPGFNALRFFAWLEEVRPTWYTAVPTMHQAILSRAARNREIIEDSDLRLIRSSSASLPSQVMAELEEVFGVPVIESYGMTEAAHQMASNPLPPQARKPGSVGLPAGPEVAIFDESGTVQDQGTVGEVVIRGANVTHGYEANPEANATAFDDGWFRTGDQGYLDEDGYLTITGRLKEIINRGGEKISPLEVDEILMDHEAVAQAVTFALPHDKLGEDVAAAIVLRDGSSLTEKELRDFAAQRLAAFKVPRTIVFLEEIPKGATGKLQRIGLADKLGLTETSAAAQ